ncbi:hypothetical protein [Alicyclobacillus suci]|uniref:hypothetical protein n=1 Tax=Alicyclobacillus suci TaxID=2816080 RepID=UPI001A8CB6FA|nr:hypothetical protein [Alicyclobacillus suci]
MTVKKHEEMDLAVAARWGVNELPTLRGSEKQIAWAESLRKDALEWLRVAEKDAQSCVAKIARRAKISEEEASALLRQRVASIIGAESAESIIDARLVICSGMLLMMSTQIVKELRGL